MVKTARDLFMELHREVSTLGRDAEQLCWYGFTYGYDVAVCPGCKGVGTCASCDGEAHINCMACDGEGHYVLTLHFRHTTIAATVQCRQCFGEGGIDCGHCYHGQARCSVCEQRRVILTPRVAA